MAVQTSKLRNFGSQPLADCRHATSRVPSGVNERNLISAAKLVGVPETGVPRKGKHFQAGVRVPQFDFAVFPDTLGRGEAFTVWTGNTNRGTKGGNSRETCSRFWPVATSHIPPQEITRRRRGLNVKMPGWPFRVSSRNERLRPSRCRKCVLPCHSPEAFGWNEGQTSELL